MNPYRVVIADDHQLFLDGLRLVLSLNQRFQIVGEAKTGSHALHLLGQAPADLVVLDINMPDPDGPDGLETAKIIKARYPQIRILMVTMLSHISYIKRLMRIGVEGYILKDSGQRVFLAAMEAIVSGKNYYSEEVTQTIVKGMNPGNTTSGLNKVRLTHREREVLQLVAKELTTREIAERLFVAESTVITHRKNIMQKLEVSNSVGMVRLATEFGLLS